MAKSNAKAGQTLNKSELCDFLATTPKTVDAWLEQGLPYVSRANKQLNIHWEFDSAEVVGWLRHRDSERALASVRDDSEDGSKKRKAAADAEMAELNLAKRKGELMEVSEVIKAGVTSFTNCKTRLLGIPSKLSPVLAAMNDVQQIRQRIEAEIYQALNELSRFAGPGSDEDSADSIGLDECAGTAAETDSQ